MAIILYSFIYFLKLFSISIEIAKKCFKSSNKYIKFLNIIDFPLIFDHIFHFLTINNDNG